MNVGGKEDHAENTWTHSETRVNWLKSLLPEQLPNARILAFQYNANIAFGVSSGGVKEQAINLLWCLIQKRKLNPTRPIIFIAHSLGGILVKEALAIAFRYYEAYPMISTFTFAIFFLAVPHKGSGHAASAQALANTITLATNQPTNTFLESVTAGSKYSEELSSRFEPLHEAYMFYSWIEGLPLWPSNLIVPQDSATLGLLPTREQCRLTQRNHRTICKFSGADDLEWLELSAAIRGAAHMAITSFNYSPTIPYRSAMFTPWGQQDNKAAISLSKAMSSAQSIINEVDAFRTGTLQSNQSYIEGATGIVSKLIAVLIAEFGPLLSFLLLLAPGLLANLAWGAALAILPSKEQVLERGREGQEAEEKIMEVEESAIKSLDDYQHRLLEASYVLQDAACLNSPGDSDDPLAVQFSDIQILQQKQKLVRYTELTTQDLHKRHQSYNRARNVWNQIEEVRREADGQDDREFFTETARRAERLRVAQEESGDENSGRCPLSCVIQ